MLVAAMNPTGDDHPGGRYQPGLSTLSAVVDVLEDSVAGVDAGTILLKLANHLLDQRIRPAFRQAAPTSS